MRETKGSWARCWVYLTAILILTFLSACAGGRSSRPALGQSPGPEETLSRVTAEGLGYSNTIHIKPDGTAHQKLQASFHRFPLSFIPNRGQVDERVKFYSRSGSAGFFFTPTEVVYSFVQREKDASPQKVRRSIPDEDPGPRGERKGRGLVVRLRFVGANPDPVIEGKEALPGKVSYFTGSDPSRWKGGLPTYGQVRYRELWPGIDLIYRGQGGKLKYEFVVKPGADPGQIRLVYSGIEGMGLSDSGDLILQTAFGELCDGRPVTYQEIGGRRVEVEVNFRVGTARSAFVHGFQVKSYNPAYPLILDPGLDYSTFLGGSGTDAGLGIVLDVANNAYVTGWTTSSDFSTTAGAFDISYNGSDAFVTKLSSDGSTLLYSTFLGGSAGNGGREIAVDATGNAYVTGWTQSSDFPATAGAFDTSFNGGEDAFVAKLSSDGSTLLYATFLGGSGSDSVLGIALDGAGNAYLTGETFPPLGLPLPGSVGGLDTVSDFPTTAGAFDTSFNGGGDAFAAKLSADGSTLLYATFLGGNSNDWGSGITLDSTGNAYLTGGTWSSDFPATAGAFDTSFNGRDAFVAKLSSDGSTLLYSTFLGGNDYDEGSGISVDATGNAYLTGETTSSDFPATAGAFDTSFNGFYDAFVAKLSNDGSALLYSTFLGGSDWDSGQGIALDTEGSAYVTGETSSGDFPITVGAFDPTFNDSIEPDIGGDAFVAKLNADGSRLLYATFLGGSSGDSVSRIILDGAGNAYVTGWTTSSDFPTTAEAFDTSYNGPGGGGDAFVVKLSLGPPLATLTVVKAGNGSGTVTSSPTGINCGADCSWNYVVDTSVTLTATPDNGSTFTGWRDACSGRSPCTLTIDSAKTAMAIFTTPLTIGASALEGEVGVTYQGSLGISGGLPPYGISVIKGALPLGLSPDSEGIIGTPTKAGLSSFTVRVIDDLGFSEDKKVRMRVFPALTISTRSLGRRKIGRKYSATLKAAGGKKDYAWSLASGELPEGLSLESSTGRITGIPAASGSFDLTFRVTDALGGTVTKSLLLDIN